MNRLTTSDIRNWLKGLLGNTFNTYYINRNNKNKQPNQKKLGVYYTKNSLPHLLEVMGGYTEHRDDYFTILIIGTDDYEESLELAEEVFNKFINNNLIEEINEIRINQIELLTQVQDVSDFDNEGLYEFVINIKVNYQY